MAISLSRLTQHALPLSLPTGIAIVINGRSRYHLVRSTEYGHLLANADRPEVREFFSHEQIADLSCDRRLMIEVPDIGDPSPSCSPLWEDCRADLPGAARARLVAHSEYLDMCLDRFLRMQVADGPASPQSSSSEIR